MPEYFAKAGMWLHSPEAHLSKLENANITVYVQYGAYAYADVQVFKLDIEQTMYICLNEI